MEDVKTKVFEYVKVLARPMVLYQHDHPIHWTPAYVGGEVLCLNNYMYNELSIYLFFVRQ